MKYIAHRANRNGPSPDKENTTGAIQECLERDMSVEVDVRLWRNALILGHDKLQEEVELTFLINSNIWVHAKTPETFYYLTRFSNIQCFYQENDEIALTSNGYLWCHSNLPLPGPRSILTILNMQGQVPRECYAVCTDYPAASYVSSVGQPKLILLDVDGVMTNGKKIYGRDGRVFAKEFCDKDFTAIKRFQAAGIKVGFITGDLAVNLDMATWRGLQLIHNPPGVDKHSLITEIMTVFRVGADQIVYVGDDYYDLLMIQALDHTYCPSDAIRDVQKAVNKVLPCKGGEGVVAALYEELRGKLPEVYPPDSKEVNPP